MSVLQTWHVTFALGACSYYGALMAYCGVHQFLRTPSAETVTALLQTKVFPLYAMVSPTPYVLANANWLWGSWHFT